MAVSQVKKHFGQMLDLSRRRHANAEDFKNCWKKHQWRLIGSQAFLDLT